MQFITYRRLKKLFFQSIKEFKCEMSLQKQISKTLFILALLILPLIIILSEGCSSSKKNPYYEKRAKASGQNASQLGRNRYYFSNSYQKKLNKSYKRK